MSSLQSSEGTQVNEGAEAFSKLESEIGELVRRDTTAPRLQQGNDYELNVGSLVNTQVNDGVDVFSKLEGEIREHVGSMVQKVSGNSVQEVENLVTEQRPSGASNSSLESRERTQVDEGVGVFSKLEGEIREHVGSVVQKVSGTSVQEVENLITEQRPSGASNSSLESLERTQVDEGVGVFSKLEGEIREHVGSMVQKVSGTSVQEVENLITEQRPSGASNSSLESLERTQVDEGVGVFSKLEGEIREHVGSMVQKVSGTS